VLGPADEIALIDLSFNWGSAYDIAVLDGVWSAKSVDHPATILTADGPEELRRLIRADYGNASRRAGEGRITGYVSERMST
jgi:hypothetical protein